MLDYDWNKIPWLMYQELQHDLNGDQLNAKFKTEKTP